LQALTKSGKFKWDKNGQISLKDRLYPNSKITELISSFIHESIKFHYLRGSDAFLLALKAEAVPEYFEIPENVRVTKPKTKKIQGAGDQPKTCDRSSWIRFEETFQFKTKK